MSDDIKQEQPDNTSGTQKGLNLLLRALTFGKHNTFDLPPRAYGAVPEKYRAPIGEKLTDLSPLSREQISEASRRGAELLGGVADKIGLSPSTLRYDPGAEALKTDIPANFVRRFIPEANLPGTAIDPMQAGSRTAYALALVALMNPLKLKGGSKLIPQLNARLTGSIGNSLRAKGYSKLAPWAEGWIARTGLMAGTVTPAARLPDYLVKADNAPPVERTRFNLSQAVKDNLKTQALKDSMNDSSRRALEFNPGIASMLAGAAGGTAGWYAARRRKFLVKSLAGLAGTGIGMALPYMAMAAAQGMRKKSEEQPEPDRVGALLGRLAGAGRHMAGAGAEWSKRHPEELFGTAAAGAGTYLTIRGLPFANRGRYDPYRIAGGTALNGLAVLAFRRAANRNMDTYSSRDAQMARKGQYPEHAFFQLGKKNLQGVAALAGMPQLDIPDDKLNGMLWRLEEAHGDRTKINGIIGEFMRGSKMPPEAVQNAYELMDRMQRNQGDPVAAVNDAVGMGLKTIRETQDLEKGMTAQEEANRAAVSPEEIRRMNEERKQKLKHNIK